MSKEPRFEEQFERLEALVEALESGDLGLEETLDQYEKGVGVVRDLTKRLTEAEQRIETLDSLDDD